MKANKAPQNRPELPKRKPLSRKKEKLTLLKLIRPAVFIILGITVLTCMLTNTLAVYKEIALLELHEKTHDLFMENIDKNVNVEFAKSIYNINFKAKNLSNLHKPDKIIEVDLKNQNLSVDIVKLPQDTKVRVVGGY